MMNRFFAFLLALLPMMANAEDIQGTLIKGGQFMDRIMPMPVPTAVKSSAWGPGVADRYVANGVEDDHVSFWGGNVLKGDDGKYNMIVNDWNARQAFYSRSADGVHWVTEQGYAYKPGCVRPPKMLGEDNSGNMIYGYARLPWYEYDAPIVSARYPLVYNNKVTRVTIENYGMKTSAATTFTVKDNKGATVARSSVSALPAYGSETVEVEQLAEITSGAKRLIVTFANGETNTFTCDMKDSDIIN